MIPADQLRRLLAEMVRYMGPKRAALEYLVSLVQTAGLANLPARGPHSRVRFVDAR